jgi:hypothetical protein
MKQNSFFIFLFGLIYAQKINIVGEIYVGELISLIYVFFNLIKLRYSEFELKLLFYTFLTSLLIILINFYHETDFDKILKGVFAFIVFCSSIIFLIRYLEKFEDFKQPILFFFGSIVGRFVYLIYAEAEMTSLFYYNPWKFGIGISLVEFILLITLFFKKEYSKIFWIILVITIVYISFVNNSRALPLMLIIAFISYHLFYKSEKRSLKFYNKRSTFILLPLGFFLIVMLSGIIFTKFESINMFSSQFETMLEKNSKQSKGAFGVTVSARGALIDAFYAIKDRPLIGHGSYPEDKGSYYKMKELEFLYKYKYIDFIPNPNVTERFFGNTINGHSVIFDHIIAVGLLGALFWIFILFFIVKKFAIYANYLPFFFHFKICSLFYSLFFNPWAGSTRHSISFTIIFLIIFINFLKKNKSKKNSNINLKI